MRKTPVTLGTLSIIFGSLVAAWSMLTPLLKSAFGKVGELTKNLPGQGELQAVQMEAATKSMEAQAGFMYAVSAVYFTMSVALVVIGIGLRRRRVWARKAAIAWSGIGLVWIVINTTLGIVWVQPHQREVMHAVYAQHNMTPPFELGAGSQGAILIVTMLIYAVFPTVLLALLGRRSAEGDFISEPPAA